MFLEGLDPEQQAAVVAPRGPVCVLAGAGTGKTRTITRRIAHLVGNGQVRGSQVLAVTFTARAAGEMRGRLRSLGLGAEGNSLQALTFHSAALRQLRYFWPRAIADTQWELMPSKFPVVGRAARSVRLDTGTETVRDLASEIEWAKASKIGPDEYEAAVALHGREIGFPAEQIAQAYRAYQQFKVGDDGNMLLDFDDLLIYTAGILQENGELAEEFRDRYRTFVVDEYQDVTPVQQDLLDAWLGERDDVTVVGDANQTIYSFTGASPENLLSFTRRFPDATLVRLERDYRSTPEVVTLANQVIGAARGRIAGTRLRLVGQRDPGPAPTFTECDDEITEARSVARTIKRLLASGTPASEIAILYRINAQSEVHEQALTEAGIDYQVRGGEAFFSRAEIRGAMRQLEQAAHRDDLPADADVRSVVRAVLVPLGLTDEEPSGAQQRERWQSLQALLTLVDDLMTEAQGVGSELTLEALTRELRLRSEARHPPTVQGVTLSSLHAAKGLEWDAVFLVGLVEGSLPINQAINAGEVAIEEERRLLYVGVTRAREHLHLSWALARNEGGRRSRKRTRFLQGIAPGSDAPNRESAKQDRRGGSRPGTCDVCNTQLSNADKEVGSDWGRCQSCLEPVDMAVLTALREWRTGKARELSRPPYMIFTNKVLLAIAEKLPTQTRALGSISGVGPQKLQEWGEELVALVGEHAGT